MIADEVKNFVGTLDLNLHLLLPWYKRTNQNKLTRLTKVAVRVNLFTYFSS